jgi:hypothetical protein
VECLFCRVVLEAIIGLELPANDSILECHEAKFSLEANSSELLSS